MHSIFKLLAFFLAQGDIVFDVNFGDGKYFFHLAELVGSSGSIVGFERSETMFQQLKSQPETESLWSMSLLINSKPSEWESILSVSDYTEPTPNVFPNTPSEVYFQLNKQCPKLLRVASRHAEPFGDVYSSLLASLSIVEKCPSIFLLELDPQDAVEPIIELFRSVDQDFLLYWYIPKDEDSTRRILVIPKALEINLDWLQSDVQPVATSGSVSVRATGAISGDESGDERGSEHYRKHFMFDSEVVLSSLVSEGLISHVRSASAFAKAASILYDSQIAPELLRKMANASCLVWSRRIFHSLHISSGRSEPSLHLHHLHSLFHNCTNFVQYRLNFVENLLIDRSKFKLLATADPSHVHASGSSSGVLLDRVLSHEPFELHYDEEACAEPVWCSHTLSMQQRIRQWQFPDEETSQPRSSGTKPPPLSGRTCANSKFLVFEPPSEKHGIGSMLESIVSAFRYAICLNRILVLLPLEQKKTTLKWRHPGCTGNAFECYFEPIHGCEGAFSAEELYAAHVSEHGEGFEEYPRRDERILILSNLPNQGSCSYCHGSWSRESRLFDGWFYRAEGYNQSNYYSLEMLHVDAFMTGIKQTWSAQFMRYLVGRPRKWFSELLRETVALSMVSPVTTSTVLPNAHNSKSFASLHVRFGNKVVEVALQPLTKYMSVLQAKLPHLRDVFVSTETQSVLSTLVKEYPDHLFHYLHYTRIEYFVFGVSTNSTDPQALDSAQSEWYFQQQHGLYVREFIMSLANLWVAAEGEGFVGTLSSNWCMMILQMERTRGDGGFDYLSVDGGSAFTTCF